MRLKNSNLVAEIGFNSLNHAGEQLCGDHIEVASENVNSTVLVLADGLGSGVKASILSTLTSRIISTLLAAGLSIQDAVRTIASTLPVCSERGIAYSTFTIIRIENNETAEIIEYDNPRVILLRDGKQEQLSSVMFDLDGKKICQSFVQLRDGDIFVAMSDGVVHAGVGRIYNFGWKHEDIVDFLETFYGLGYTAKTLATILLDKVNELYQGEPGDDATVCVVKIRQRVPLNLLFGPPSNPDDVRRMISLFLGKEGKHVVSGGTTGSLVANYLGKPILPSLEYIDPEIPPTGTIDGIDLVTEGVITFNQVLRYARNYLEDNRSYRVWSLKQDGASKLARLLFEEATDINFFVGGAVNPAHQHLVIKDGYTLKAPLVADLTQTLTKMGKKIKTINF